MDTCLVCGVSTNRVHFSVNCCRKDAMFYRRSVASKAVYKCRRLTKDCKITPDSRSACRYCRFVACQKAGLQLKSESNLEPDNDKPIYENTPSQQIYSTTLGRSIEVKDNKVHYDLKDTLKNIEDIFRRPMYGETKLNGIHLTCLQKATQGLQYFVKAMNMDKTDPMAITITQQMPLKDFCVFWEKFMLHCAELLMHLPNFYNLDFETKYLYFKDFWGCFEMIITLHYSMTTFGFDNEEVLIMFDNKSAHRHEPLLFTEYSTTPEVAEEVSRLFAAPLDFIVEFIYLPMKSLRLNDTELAFIILQILYSRKNMSNISQEISKHHEKLLKISATEMHNYYFYHQNIENYAWRLIQISKLIENSRAYNEREQELFLVGKIFKIFDYDLFDTELYPKYK
uniref:Nuclear receptor n=1 Tax=Rhabditophanes sp. KR3021 TaxID=114890 RepID=A0AC35UB55_9BILA